MYQINFKIFFKNTILKQLMDKKPKMLIKIIIFKLIMMELLE